MLGRLLTLTLTLLLALGTAAQAAAATPTTLTVSTDRAFAGTTTPVAVRLQAAGAPVADAAVVVERRVGGRWRVVDEVVTDAAGRATSELTVGRSVGNNLVRARYAGDATYDASRSSNVKMPIRRRDSVVTVTGPGRVVDERRVTLVVEWRARNGTPVRGRVGLFRKVGKKPWKRVARVRTNAEGVGRHTSRPRQDTRWRATAPTLSWVGGDRSRVHRVDNVPPGEPVRLPRRAPRPRVGLPDQPHAKGQGPHAVVTRIPQGVWNQMTGRSWHRGCPVGRAGLRLLRINYWDYSGYRHRGELVARADAMPRMRAALAGMYARKLPIRSMYRVDRFGWSRRLGGADDYRSMAAGNTSAFNCRDVVGRPGVRSPHAYGRALDVNPWENPYRASHGWVPNTWWVGRTHPRVAWRSRSHAVVSLMGRHGMRWTYGTQDAHHFDAPAGNGRVITARVAGCGPGVCH